MLSKIYVAVDRQDHKEYYLLLNFVFNSHKENITKTWTRLVLMSHLSCSLPLFGKKDKME